MKRFILYSLCGLLLGRHARHTIIPDDELALIFHDAFLTNAYLNAENVRSDSLRLYEPIFAHYGYTTEDVHYTIGNFFETEERAPGRRSSREAIDLLEAEGKIYNRGGRHPGYDRQRGAADLHADGVVGYADPGFGASGYVASELCG